MTTASEKRSFGSEALTRGVRVTVTPTYLADRSEPGAGRFVFGYRIRIANESDRAVQLLSRKWIIVDADGERSEVTGEGVVGQQPRIQPGSAFEYSSFCPLTTPWGTMEGIYQLKGEDGEMFDVPVARFFLVSPSAASMN